MHLALRLPALALLVAAVAGGPARSGAAEPPAAPAATPEAALRAALGALKLGDGLVAEQVILFPIVVETPPPVLPVKAALGGATVRVDELPGAVGGDKVRVTNVSDAPALLLGGTVLEGGARDRIVKADLLLAPGASAEAATMPGALASGKRKEPASFKVADFLAPPYLRESALFRGGANAVASKFISHFLEFRNEGDKRPSLAAVGQSETLAEYCLPCQRSMAQWPDKREAGFAVGGIAVVRGRVQAADAFATNGLLVAWFSPLLKSLSFPAAAIQLRAKKAGVALPGGDDPQKVLEAARAAAHELLAGFSKATVTTSPTPAGASGTSFVLTLPDGERGAALVADGVLLHLALYPRDPFEHGLYATPLQPLEGEDLAGSAGDEETGVEHLANRAKIGARLTEAERRLLERLRGN